MRTESSNDFERLSAIMQASRDAIITENLDGTITSWNFSAEKIFGYEVKEVINKNISIIIPEELFQEENKISERVKNGEQVEPYETIGKTKNGNKISIALTISPIKDEKGNVAGISKIARDITEQKQAEEKQGMLAAIVSSSDDAIISKTLNGIITSWNYAAQNMFEFTESEAIGKHISIIIPPERIKEETLIIEKIRKGERMDHFETVRVAKSGREINISLTVSPLKNKNGQVIGASKIARNITAKVELERQRQLYTKELQELNKYKDEFMAMASHELKTPVTVIKATLQLLENKMLTDVNIDFIHKTLKQVNKLSDLINDLLDVSKTQAGKLKLNYSMFDMNILLKETRDNIQQTTSDHKIIFSENEEKLITNADNYRIEQVIINILTNAIKYSPDSKDIIIDTRKNDGKIIVSVKDSGIGIPPEDLENIFSSFYRVPGLASTFSGLGIGLYISSEIIKRHGGEIWAESKEGKGSIFYFSLSESV
ncbi:MAG: PAS domain S-box protein [Ginsengibacter sp.]